MGELVIRDVTADDVPRLADAFGGAYFHQRRLARSLEGLDSYLLIEDGDEVVGHMVIRWQGPVIEQTRERLHGAPEINALAVHPSRQGQGIGSKFIAHAEDLAHQRGHRRMSIGVETANVRALALYERLGFEQWSYGETIDSWTALDADGNEITEQATVVYLTRPLSLEGDSTFTQDSLS